MGESSSWRIWPALLVLAALQATIMAHWRPLGVQPDLLLVGIVPVGLLLGPRTGFIYGLLSGLCSGWLAAIYPGSYLLSRGLAGALLGFLDDRFARDNPLAPPVSMAVAVVVANVIFLFLAPASETFSWWLDHTWRSMVVHCVLVWPLHFVYARYLIIREHRLFT